MVRALKLPRIGGFESLDLPPVAVVQSVEVQPPIRVYGRADFAVVVSEFPPSPSQAGPLARTIVSEAGRRQARWIIGLEGVIPHPETPDQEPLEEEGKVWSVSSSSKSIAGALKEGGAERLEEGVLGGVSGAMLVQALGGPVPVTVLLVSARAAELFPDHRAGAALIEVLDRVLPELKIDTGPLRAQAEEIERALRAAMKTRAGGTHPPTAAPADATPSANQMYQ
jgi:predicted ATP-grasp superfamily ATP-dependent carboligase